MQIPYRQRSEYLNVDIEKLRPQGSYGDLIAQRTHSIDGLITEYGKIPNDLLMNRECPNCQSTDPTHEMSKDHLEIVRCNQCDLVYVDPIFDEDHYNKTYRSEEYQAIVKSLGEESHLYRVNRFGKERVDIISQHLRPKGMPRFLDIGCSTGFVVEAAKGAGWDAQGIDLNPSAIEFGKARGLNLHNVALAEFAEKEAFDAIGLFDVLEHIHSPKPLLRDAVSRLKDGGILFLYVPNYDSASRMLMGKDAHFIWPSHHLTYFTPTTIKNFVESVGLQVVAMMTEGLDLIDYVWQREQREGADMRALTNVIDDLQFFVNGSLYGKNLRVVCRK